MILRSTQNLIEISTRNLPGGEARPGPKADNHTAIRAPIMWEPRRLTILWAPTAYYRDGLLKIYHEIIIIT
jgi:hypothetical protein